MSTAPTLPATSRGSLPSGRRRILEPAAFALGITAFGLAAAAIGFGLDGGNPTVTTGTVYPPLWPPNWVFWAVWLVIYPASGLAAWHVWRQRASEDVRGALTAFALMNVSSALFLPISALVGGSPAVLMLMDLNGLITVYALAWLFSRYSRSAALWMLPYLIWMPVTTALKLWLWALDGASLN